MLRSGDCEDAFLSIRSRHLGAYGFAPKGDLRGWRIDINVFETGRGRIIATQNSGFHINNLGDGVVRTFLPLNGSARIRSRKQTHFLAPNQTALAPQGEFFCEFDEGFRVLMAAFPTAVVAEALAAFSGASNVAERVNATFKTGQSLDLASRQMLALVRAVDDAPEQIIHEKRFRRAHEELLLLHLAKALDPQRESGEAEPSALYLVRALDYIHAHLTDEIGPVAIAAAAGCSLRNLQLLFARRFGQTITETLRKLRLQKARDQLSRAEDGCTITGVALDCGFSHLSDFARHYRREFGEKPSQTLARMRYGRG